MGREQRKKDSRPRNPLWTLDPSAKTRGKKRRNRQRGEGGQDAGRHGWLLCFWKIETPLEEGEIRGKGGEKEKMMVGKKNGECL